MEIPQEIYDCLLAFISDHRDDIKLKINDFENLMPILKWFGKPVKKVPIPRLSTCPVNQGTSCYTTDCAWWNFLEEECTVATLATLATIKLSEADR